MSAHNTNPPGWIQDPENPEQYRYFDGEVWPDKTKPVENTDIYQYG